MTFGHFKQLQELELLLNWAGAVHEGIISSITSTELRKVIFPASPVPDWNIFSQGTEVWASIDRQLCTLVAWLGRAGCYRMLEVEFRLLKGGDLDERDMTRFLVGFRDVGTVTVTSVVPS